ncbi:MAG: hypothetical protein JNM32_09695 [Dechloromonas sp.]|jgi:hypothetical protein|nr:hypothetical protein [Dechloromonas sp.]
MMEFSKAPTFRVTPYGDVDARQLEALRGTYDTSGLLGLVEKLDRLRPLFAAEGGLRDELLRLHAMAHAVINGASLTVAPDSTDIWEVAQDLIEELHGVVSTIEAAVETLQPLADLAPDTQ